MSGRKVALRIYVEPGKEDRCGYAMDSLKRSMRWDETAFGREYDLDIFMIVAVSDFNMGAMENKGLNVFNDKYVLASPETATDADFAQHRGGHRARVFPQLDRQPHHLPRLVPALPEGRADGLPRPGVLRRPALARGQAHRRRARPARAPVRRGRRPARPSGAAASSITRSTTSTRRPSTRRAPRSCACSRRCSARRLFRKGMDLYFDAPRRRGRDRRGVRAVLRRRRAGATSRSSCAGTRRPARPRSWRPAATTRARKTYRLDVAQTMPPTPGPAEQGADGHPARDRPGRARRPRPAADARRRADDRARRADARPGRRRRFVFTGIAERPVPSLNRGFSAPIKLVANLSADDLRLPRRARQRSVQPLAGVADAGDALLVDNVAALARRQAGRDGTSGLLDALGAILADSTLEPAFVALALTLAGRGRHRARDRPRRRSRRDLRARAPRLRARDRRASRRRADVDLTSAWPIAGPTRPDAASAGRRALRNVCLDLAGGDRAAATPCRWPRSNIRPPTT